VAQELERQPTELEILRVQRRYDLLTRLAPAVWIASLWIPLQAVQPIADALAGKDTNVAVTVSVSIVVTLSVSAGLIALMRRTREQRKELERLRKRCGELEAALEEAGGA
jgi:hypothetical protein